jgi:lipid II:glycine glycyltransferase (peptidoglycan interpeptide bridge formation enzyme)
VSTFRDHNYRQLWDFGIACAVRVGARSEHVAVHENGHLLGLADVRVKSIPFLGAGIAYINGGPLVRQADVGDAERLRAVLAALKTEYVDHRSLLLRIVALPGSVDWTAAQRAAFTACGFASNDRLPAYRTLLVDLARPLGEIRKSLAQKWRNCLNRSERNGLTIRCGSAPELFEVFCALYDEMQARKPFHVDLDPRFYACVQRHLDTQEAFQAAIAESEGRPIAGHVGSTLGDTSVYLLGATSAAALQQKAAYLLQWHAIQTAHACGCRWYDLGGIDPNGNPGVFDFKAGLGGVDVTAPGPFELLPRRLAGAVISAAEGVYRRLRTFRRRAGRLT